MCPECREKGKKELHWQCKKCGDGCNCVQPGKKDKKEEKVEGKDHDLTTGFTIKSKDFYRFYHTPQSNMTH